MKPLILTLAATSVALPAFAQETREMEAHVHGVSKAQIAMEHGTVEINILSPGMDIVGFEYKASTSEDKDAVQAAIRTMLIPENLVTLPEAAGCRITEVLAHLHVDDHEEDDDHDHEDHADDDHDHGHDHEDHAEEAQHSEFHVRYIYECEEEDAVTTVNFPFFAAFENAQEIEVEYVTETGAGQAEVTREAAEVALQ